MVARDTQRGFTLVELTVAVSIFLIFTGVTLFNYPKFSNKISLDLLSHNIALTIRQAQTYGLGVRAFESGSIRFPAYGVHFDATSPRSFVLFADECGAPDKLYAPAQCPPGNPQDVEFFDRFSIPQTTNSIKAICMNKPDVDPQHPELSPECTGTTSLDISFKSPRPDARIYANGNTATSGNDAEIILTNNRSDTRTIIIRKTGQISIQ